VGQCDPDPIRPWLAPPCSGAPLQESRTVHALIETASLCELYGALLWCLTCLAVMIAGEVLGTALGSSFGPPEPDPPTPPPRSSQAGAFIFFAVVRQLD
jgi:hypothetical protein